MPSSSLLSIEDDTLFDLSLDGYMLSTTCNTNPVLSLVRTVSSSIKKNSGTQENDSNKQEEEKNKNQISVYIYDS